MPCFHPVRLQSDSRAKLVVACGQCRGCRLERSRQWAVRCVHEASLYERNAFLTLTYDDEHLPVSGSLDYRDFQLFIKRLRRRFFSFRVRFFMCGEYGEKLGRPHFHACLFGFDFDDKLYFRRSPGGSDIFTSKALDELWGKGFSSVGSVSFESAAYVARYVMKKVNGDAAADHYAGRVPEFCHMSLKPGIGSDWLRLYWPEVIENGKVLSKGYEAPAPRFYLRRLKKLSAFEQIEYRRFQWSLKHMVDYTPGRLAIREQVEAARVRSLKRVL